nr:MAG TPA: hypothetical protein [Bacteriophage sp.]
MLLILCEISITLMKRYLIKLVLWTSIDLE